MKKRTVASLEELASLENLVTRTAAHTAERLARELQHTRDLSVLARLKFEPVGCDPLDPERALNFVEQLNQSFTYLATIEGVRWLLQHYPSHAPYEICLGTAAGPDIVSEDGQIAGETFAATHPDSNDKLRKDVEKVRRTPATHRFVFYLSPEATKRTAEDVVIVRLDHACIPLRMPNSG